MNEFDNTNRGAIWKNPRKRKETHPDFSGNINVDGKEYWVSAWKRSASEDQSKPALTFSVKSKDEAKPTSDGSVFENDDIPF